MRLYQHHCSGIFENLLYTGERIKNDFNSDTWNNRYNGHSSMSRFVTCRWQIARFFPICFEVFVEFSSCFYLFFYVTVKKIVTNCRQPRSSFLYCTAVVNNIFKAVHYIIFMCFQSSYRMNKEVTDKTLSKRFFLMRFLLKSLVLNIYGLV